MSEPAALARTGQATSPASLSPSRAMPRVAIVGNPNVGKSVLFNRLTGAYVTVSNYPGTTVEVSRGRGMIDGLAVEVIDTPGIYSFQPISEEERVARQILLTERPDAVLHVVDAKNLERMLPLTFQLVEANLNVILVVNMVDESRRLGIGIDSKALAEDLGVPVILTVSTQKEGLPELRRQIHEACARIDRNGLGNSAHRS
ncbi:MAG: 50S ribosome-binding GTPase [Planctomycetes bacterium]|nr:50S ribosome-binding GTPase [Planctomycetota bacterium]MBI3844564.1 50S ribosome-binding GTPase [Planctomycetota bacterium]